MLKFTDWNFKSWFLKCYWTTSVFGSCLIVFLVSGLVYLVYLILSILFACDFNHCTVLFISKKLWETQCSLILFLLSNHLSISSEALGKLHFCLYQNIFLLGFPNTSWKCTHKCHQCPHAARLPLSSKHTQPRRSRLLDVKQTWKVKRFRDIATHKRHCFMKC